MVSVLDDGDVEGHEGAMKVKWLVTVDCKMAMVTATTTQWSMCWTMAMPKDNNGRVAEVMVGQG